MEQTKKIFRKLLYPPVLLLIPMVIAAAAMLTYVFAAADVGPILKYGSYGLSSYALVIACLRIPAVIRGWKRLGQENAFLRRYRSDIRLRTKISLYSSIAVNLAYALFQLCLGIYHSSVWFYAFACYYFLLTVMRFFLAKETARFTPGAHRLRELLLYRFCGVLMLLMNLALSVIVGYIVWQGRTFRHHEITAIAMAAYTFTALTLAIINTVKYRKYQSPVLSAAKTISLASASVSMLTLETAMLTAFGGDDRPKFRAFMTGTTGAAVCLFVLGLASFMIARSTKEIRKFKEENVHG